MTNQDFAKTKKTLEEIFEKAKNDVSLSQKPEGLKQSLKTNLKAAIQVGIPTYELR